MCRAENPPVAAFSARCAAVVESSRRRAVRYCANQFPRRSNHEIPGNLTFECIENPEQIIHLSEQQSIQRTDRSTNPLKGTKWRTKIYIISPTITESGADKNVERYECNKINDQTAFFQFFDKVPRWKWLGEIIIHLLEDLTPLDFYQAQKIHSSWGEPLDSVCLEIDHGIRNKRLLPLARTW